MVPSNVRQYDFMALADIWTGNAERRGDRLITVGLLGSLRWWFEIVVRGLGGFACDPSDPEMRCPDKAGKRCVVCEFFGCTGWARKFRFEVLDEKGQIKQKAIRERELFKLNFIPLRPVSDEEWALLELTLLFISEYAAISGKTVFKPSEEKGREDRDFGLIQIQDRLKVQKEYKELKEYVAQERWRKADQSDFAWASLQNFWCVKGRYLCRKSQTESTFNRVLGRCEGKAQAQQLEPSDSAAAWLAGGRQESKKVFSFKAGEGRTFGFVKPGLIDFKQMKERLKRAWKNLQYNEFLTGQQIIERLLSGGAKESGP